MNQPSEVIRGRGSVRPRPELGRPLLVAPPTGRRGPGVAGDPVSDVMEPGPERVAHPESARLAHQDQECGLECILGIVRVA